MPLVGMVLCCCRVCCKKCGGKVKPREGKRAKCSRITCGLFLALFTVVMLFAGVAMFLVNSDLHEKLTGADNRVNVISKIENSVDNLNVYVRDQIIKGVNDNVMGKVTEVKNNIFIRLDAVATETNSKLGDITSVTAILAKAKALASSVSDIQNNLNQVILATNNLKNTSVVLSQNLTDLRNGINTTIQKCSSLQLCTDMQSQLSDLRTSADFTQVDDVSSQLSSYNQILNANISDLIQQGEKEFYKISGRIQNETDSRIDEFKKEAEKLEKEAKNSTESLLDSVRAIQTSLSTVQKSIRDDVKPNVGTYEDYRFYAFIGLTALLCLILLIYCLGLIVGIMGDPPNTQNTCNRGKGATILIGGVYCTFLFVWLFMLVVLLLFVIFGLLINNELCHPVTVIVESPTSAGQQNAVAGILDFSVSQIIATNGTQNISLTSFISDCKQDKPIYAVLEPFLSVDLSQILNLNDFQITSRINELIDKANIDLSGVQVLTNDTREQLDAILTSGLDNINFTSFFTQLDKSLTAINLDDFRQNLLNVSSQLKIAAAGPPPNASTNETAYEFQGHAETIKAIQDSTLAQMVTDKNKLNSTISKLEETAKGTGSGSKNMTTQTKELIDAFEAAQELLTNNGSAIIKEAVRVVAEDILNQVNQTLINAVAYIKTQLGPCRPVYSTLQTGVVVLCENLINPINGFWFCLGACMFFFIPNIILAVKLGTLYRKTQPYETSEGFEKGDYELYSRRGSHKRKQTQGYHDDEDMDSNYLVDNQYNKRKNKQDMKEKKKDKKRSKSPPPYDSRNGHTRNNSRQDRYDNQRDYHNGRQDRNSHLQPQNTRPYSQYAASRYDDHQSVPSQNGYPRSRYDDYSYQQQYGNNNYAGNSYAHRSYDDYARNGYRYNSSYPNGSYGGDSYGNQGYADRAGYG